MFPTKYPNPKSLLQPGMKVLLETKGANTFADVAYGMDGSSLVLVLYENRLSNPHYVTKVIPLSEYNDKLEHDWFSVSKIYSYERWPVGSNGVSYGNEIIWEREKEMTLEEIEDIVGCKIKIVDNK